MVDHGRPWPFMAVHIRIIWRAMAVYGQPMEKMLWGHLVISQDPRLSSKFATFNATNNTLGHLVSSQDPGLGSKFAMFDSNFNTLGYPVITQDPGLSSESQ